MIDEKTFRRSVAANVVRLREAKGMSQGELAEALGISQVHLCRIEKEKASPSAELLFSLADALGVPADALRQISEKISAKAS